MTLSQPNDFAQDVLETLKSRQVVYHGCLPWYLEERADGDIKIWFYGHRNGGPWAGGITIHSRPDIDSALARGNSQVFAEICEKVIDDIKSRVD